MPVWPKVNRPRDRSSAAGLLPRMEARPWRDGKTVTFRYHPIGGRPINLGTDRAEAIRRVLDMNRSGAASLSDLWRAYQTTPAWLRLAAGTRVDYTQASGPLLRVFGDVTPASLRPADIYRYLNVERAESPGRAVREFAVLSNLCQLAIERGELDVNPCKSVKPGARPARTEAVSPEALRSFLDWAQARGDRAAVVLAGMAEFIALCGSRRVEFRGLHWTQVSDTEVRLTRAKQRGAAVSERIEISPALADLLARMRAIAPDPRIGAVFPAHGGDCYNDSAFKSAWSRLQREAVEAGALPKRIRFHDLRAYYVTMHKQLRASLPDLHGNPAITARVYERSKMAKRKAL